MNVGYLTEFHFSCDCGDKERMEQIVQKMQELQIVPYVFEKKYYNSDSRWYDLDNCGSRTWYAEEDDMRALSRAFPDVHFIIGAYGEINDDIWEAHYLGGKRQLCEAEIRIPEFDPEKLT